MVSSKKYNGVYHTVLGDGDVTYYIYYRDEANQQRKTKVGRKSEGITEEHCNRMRLNTIASVKEGGSPPNVILKNQHKVITLNVIADYYFQHHNGASTKRWQSKYDLRIKAAIGDTDVEHMGSSELESLRKSLLSAELANSTINCYMDIVSAICNFALRNQLYNGRNPTKFMKKLRVDNVREKFLNNEEVILLLTYVKPNQTLYLFVKLALSTGGRFQTILDIKKRDVNLTDGIITLKDHKNNSTYSGYICDSELSDLLRIRMDLIGNNDFIVFLNGVANIRRYISRKLSSVFYDLFNYDLDETDENYRKQKVVIHTLRHTFLSHLALKGTSPFVLKRLSNHKSLSMVERYAKLNPTAGKDVVVGLYSDK